MSGITDQEAKRLRLEHAVALLVETLCEIEGTPFLRATITSGTSGTFDMVVEKRSKITRPPPKKVA